MPTPKISILTVAYNAEATIERCIQSVISQKGAKFEYIIIDGSSTDRTKDIIEQYRAHINIYLSENDNGIYDAMNKGIKLASGDVIGILNADDVFDGEDVIKAVANTFEANNCLLAYGDIQYIDSTNKVIRKWISGKYRHGKFNYGWMPPHTAFFAARALFERYGDYDLSYGSAADYELMARFIHKFKIMPCYINRNLTKMIIGGVSNRSSKNRLAAWRNDYKAMKKNGIGLPILAVIFKPIRKIFQYL